MRITKLARAGGLIAFLIAQLVLVQAQASFIPVSIAGVPPNVDLRTYTNGTNYPSGPTTLTAGGVPFDLIPLDSLADTLGIIQDDGNDVFIIPTSIFGATTVYTLMNSSFGVFGADIATIEFTGTGGASASFDLIEGFNIRDHFNGFYNNIVTDPSIVTVNFGGDVRLDRQTFVLPASFATETLTQITLTGHTPGAPDEEFFFINGLAFLAAVTVATPAIVPEPTATALLGIALIAAFFFLQRRRLANWKLSSP